MKLYVTRGTGRVQLEIEGLTDACLPALRLVQVHSPQLSVVAMCGAERLIVPLKDVDLAPSLFAGPLNQDRAQLAALGGSGK